MVNCIKMNYSPPGISLGARCIVTEKQLINASPRLDEESFTRLLAAAYVMQEHQDRVRAKLPSTDFGQVISQIVDTQHLIQTRKLDTDAALDLIAERIQGLSRATGSTIALLDEDDADILCYRAISGTTPSVKGRRVEAQASVSASCIKTSEKLLSPLGAADPRFDSETGDTLNARSLFVVPVYYEGKIAGSIELFFSEANAFSEADIRATELMAGLVTEVLAQASESRLKRELAAERASVLMALERIKPQLERLSGEQSALLNKVTGVKGETHVCHSCGHVLSADEHSCTECGEFQLADSGQSLEEPGKNLQGKWAALWERQKEALGDSVVLPDRTKELADEPAGNPSTRTNGANGFVLQADENQSWSSASSSDADEIFWKSDENENHASTAPEIEEPGSLEPVEETSLIAAKPATDKRSRVQAWLAEKLDDLPWKKRAQHLWLTRKGDVSLVAAGVVMGIALIWGLWPHHNVSASPANNQAAATQAARKRRFKPPEPQLTAFEKVLVGLGLAEPPPAPAYLGDPNINVWVDLQSAYYYCPGAELYGKTEKGKFTTQADAQQDQFEPAFRRPCD